MRIRARLQDIPPVLEVFPRDASEPALDIKIPSKRFWDTVRQYVVYRGERQRLRRITIVSPPEPDIPSIISVLKQKIKDKGGWQWF